MLIAKKTGKGTAFLSKKEGKSVKILYVTSQSGRRINGFMRSAILAAKGNGDQFVLASNMKFADHAGYAEDCASLGIETVHIDFDRNPLGKSNLAAAKQLLSTMRNGNFDVVHCNTPIGGVLGRWCAHQAGIKNVIYQAHGFHFWKGAPLKNWLLYYPVERLLAHFTDILITINHEDYERAKKFKASKVIYIPGVGIDTQKFTSINSQRRQKRQELNLHDDDFALLSVGELIKRKNHEVVLRALAKMKGSQKYDKLHYYICGKGELEDRLKELAMSLGIAEHVHFLGFRSDIADLCNACDQYIFMSYQEGLAIALMEAMACGIPIICSPIRGNVDLIEHDVSGYIAGISENEVVMAIDTVMSNREKYQACASVARNRVQEFGLESVVQKMREMYQSISG